MNSQENLRVDAQRIVARSVVLASADAVLRQRLKIGLSDLRWTVFEAKGGADAMAQVEHGRPEALLLDDWLPDLEVTEFSTQMMSLYPGMEVLRLDGSLGRQGSGSRSPRRNELLHAVRRAQQDAPASSADGSKRELDLVEENNRTLRRAPGAPAEETPERTRTVAAEEVASLPEMIGESGVMRELTHLIRLVAPRRATVLIEGETGTGKEVVAKAVHRLSERAAKTFTVLNCAAIPESLLEAELFGHTRGAFTGAVQSRTGRIEAAHGGTLFLDEIGEMPLALQAKMLRFLECGELQRVGDNETMRVDVRVIAATHQHLEERSERGTFRMDLYHRLAVFPLTVPPLRKRLDDLGLLVECFLEQMGKDSPRKKVAPEALAKLSAYDWPGNVRELKHVLERGAILSGDSPEITSDDIRLRARPRV